MSKFEAAARRVAAMHYFAGCMTKEDADFVWTLTEMTEDEAEKLLKSNQAVFLWEPFEDYPLSHTLEWMKHLRDHIIHELDDCLGHKDATPDRPEWN